MSKPRLARLELPCDTFRSTEVSTKREIRELRSSIARLPRKGPRGRRVCPASVREAGVALMRRTTATGQTLESTARSVGIPLTTLSSWLVSQKAGGERPTGMRRVRVAEA